MALLYEVREGIAYISFNRPEKHNAFRDEDLAALVESLQRFDAEEGAQIAILSGQGRSFSSGGDVAERLERSVEEGSTSGRVTEGEAFLGCRNWKPVIAAVHGYCLGHALATALLCDHLVAARDAVFQVTEIKLGLSTASSVPRLGKGAFAEEVAMTGRYFTAEEARQAGIVTRLVDEGQHLAAAEELARQILGNPARAVRENVRIRRRLMAEEVARYQSESRPYDWATSGDARQAVADLATRVRRHP